MRIEESKRVVEYVKENNIRVGTILCKENQYYMIADIEFSELSQVAKDSKVRISLIRVQQALFPEPHFKVMDNDFWFEKGVDKVFFQIDLFLILEYEVVGYDIELHKRGLNYGWNADIYKRTDENFMSYMKVLSTLEDGVYYVGYAYLRLNLYIILKTGVEDVLSTEILSVPLDDLNVDLSQINASETVERILTENFDKLKIVTLKDIDIMNDKWEQEGKVREEFNFSTYALKVRMLCG